MPVGLSVSDAVTGGSVLGILLLSKARAITGQNPTVDMAGIPVSTKQQETYEYQADITEHAVESGAYVHDHVILRPIRLTISFGVANWDKGTPEKAQELLEKLFNSRTPVSLVTKHKILNNMVMASLSMDNSLPNWGALSCRATFHQIKYVVPEKIRYPAKVKPTAKTTGPAKPKAAEAPQPLTNKSLLSGLAS